MSLNGHPVRVLVANDEQIITDTLALILEKSGYAAKAAYSADQAVETAGSWKPDVLISDVLMKGITGIEAAIQIVTDCPACQVILVSGQAATFELIADGCDQGHHFEVLSKPVHPQALIDRIATLACGRGIHALDSASND